MNLLAIVVIALQVAPPSNEASRVIDVRAEAGEPATRSTLTGNVNALAARAALSASTCPSACLSEPVR